jgi:hypothetical protein
VPLLAVKRVTFAPEMVGCDVWQATPGFLNQRPGRHVHFTCCRNVAERLQHGTQWLQDNTLCTTWLALNRHSVGAGPFSFIIYELTVWKRNIPRN